MRSKQPVEITLAYLDKFKTSRGGYNKKQVEALGLKWPLTSGWKNELVGTFISGENADIFEANSKKVGNNKKPSNVELALKTIESKVSNLTIKDIYRLRVIEKRYFEIINKTK